MSIKLFNVSPSPIPRTHLPQSPKGPVHYFHQNQPIGGHGGNTAGIGSSGEEDEDGEVDEDDEYNNEDKKLLEDVKITADDIVIVASFKLPISVYKDS